ncbi:hypothetical protein C8F01DRAFT_1243636 [Mycena amicta]|nr:hypothetical protein C8F01DRAFT_1243636 [Mycena amicta]
MATIKTSTPALPDYITYRFANRLVYVRPAQTYEKEFVELADILGNAYHSTPLPQQLCGGIIDILVSPDPNSPPTYLAVPTDMMKEEIDILQKSRSASASPPPPRRSSPASRSTKSAKRSWLPRIGTT